MFSAISHMTDKKRNS